MPAEFDLLATTKQVLFEGGCDSFAAYAERLLQRIPKSEYANVLRRVLTEYVREVDHHARPVVAPQPGQQSSPKVRAIANAWAQFTARHIATEQGTQIRLADASEGQVRFYAGLLRVKASEVARTAESFDKLADAMAAHKARRVADLPAKVGREIATAA